MKIGLRLALRIAASLLLAGLTVLGAGFAEKWLPYSPVRDKVTICFPGFLIARVFYPEGVHATRRP